MIGGTTVFARLDQSRQCDIQTGELFQSLVHPTLSLLGRLFDAVAATSWQDAKRKQLTDFLQGEAQPLGSPNEFDSVDFALGILPVAGGGSLWCGKERPPLVIPQGLDAHPAPFGQATNSQSHIPPEDGPCTIV